jgi:hypothetical protein
MSMKKTIEESGMKPEKHRLIMALLLILGFVSPLAAQETGRHTADEPPLVNAGEAVPVGPFLFTPTLQLTWQHRDNIFFTPDNEIADNVLLARARLQFELPVYESYIRFSYTPQWREYDDWVLTENWSHFFDLTGGFEFANGVVLNADYRYVYGNLETREVDPGGELVFGDRPFGKHFAALGVDYWVTERDGISVEANYTDLEHDLGVQGSLEERYFYDYSRSSARIGWIHQLSPILVMDLKYGYIDFDPDRTFDSRDDFRQSTSDEITAGFRGQLSPVVATELRVGWRETDYKGPDVDDYSSIVVNGFVNWDLAHGSAVRLDLLVSDYPSNFGTNAGYTATGASLIYTLNRSGWYGQARGRIQNNDYDEPDPRFGEKRSDDILTLGLGLGYRFSDLLSLYGSYLYEDRDTLYDFAYTANIFSIGLVVGY